MTRFRWWLFRHMSTLGWWVCPEPHRSRLQRGIGSWQEVENRISEEEGDRTSYRDAVLRDAAEAISRLLNVYDTSEYQQGLLDAEEVVLALRSKTEKASD